MEIKPIIIRTIEDLIPLDDRQLDACLKDLKTWVKFRQNLDLTISAMRLMVEAQTGLKGEGLEKVMDVELQDHMAWVDDGIEGGTVNRSVVLKDDDGKEVEGFSQETKLNVSASGKITAA